jgi:phospholipid transport system substrate-binding protein
MVRRVGVALLFLVCVGAGGAAQAAQAEDAQQLVVTTSQQVLGALARERELLGREPGRIYQLVEQYVLPHFDFARMSQWALGRHWRTATPEQQARLVVEFRTLLVRTYATALLEYSGQDVSFLPLRSALDATDVTVRTSVRRPGGTTVPINYSLYLQGDAWKVYDVTIDGISLVSNYRTSFANEVQQRGLDGLIQRLIERNAG